jgi:hypothetical protein
MMMEKAKTEKSIADVVLVDLSEGSAIKFISHRGYDALLCNHVYMGFCQNCPQHKCRKRRI